MEMTKAAQKGTWRVVSGMVARDAVEFGSLEELLEALEGLGLNMSGIWIWSDRVASRSYVENGLPVIEAFHQEFNPTVWRRNPGWYLIAELAEEEEEEVTEMKRWQVVSDWVGGEPVEFADLGELLEALRELGINVDALEEFAPGRLGTRCYTDPGRQYVVAEAFNPDEFDREMWLARPDWHTVAELVDE